MKRKDPNSVVLKYRREVRIFNDYTRGAFEALSWLEGLIEELRDHPKGWKILEREVNDAIVDIKRGVGVDFRHRLRVAA